MNCSLKIWYNLPVKPLEQQQQQKLELGFLWWGGEEILTSISTSLITHY
jgi:hypothetical protein